MLVNKNIVLRTFRYCLHRFRSFKCFCKTILYVDNRSKWLCPKMQYMYCTMTLSSVVFRWLRHE